MKSKSETAPSGEDDSARAEDGLYQIGEPIAISVWPPLFNAGAQNLSMARVEAKARSMLQPANTSRDAATGIHRYELQKRRFRFTDDCSRETTVPCAISGSVTICRCLAVCSDS